MTRKREPEGFRRRPYIVARRRYDACNSPGRERDFCEESRILEPE
jgi:hypothetical protein